MPAQRLSNQPATTHPFDVLAQSDGVGNLMLHALLCNESATRNDVTNDTIINSFHMGPPLGPRRAACDAVGSANLTDEQREKVKTFIKDRREEKAAEKKRLQALGLDWDSSSQYRIQPAATRPSRKHPLWRFSCVGLVLQAYKAARVSLLRRPFPLKTADDLKRVYPHFASDLEDADTRIHLGIGTGDRWPVALVGYVMHSLARPSEEINGPAAEPYQPQEGDEYFPRESDAVEQPVTGN